MMSGDTGNRERAACRPRGDQATNAPPSNINDFGYQAERYIFTIYSTQHKDTEWFYAHFNVQGLAKSSEIKKASKLKALDVNSKTEVSTDLS